MKNKEDLFYSTAVLADDYSRDDEDIIEIMDLCHAGDRRYRHASPYDDAYDDYDDFSDVANLFCSQWKEY